ncbi:MAG: hypothetical protein ACMXYM_01045 [Candidatus Woesearchaeota archaeon]
MAIEQIFTWFMTSGAYDALLPFFLVFTLVFAFLQKSKLFDKGDSDGSGKKFNVMLALIIGLMVVVPSVTNSYPSGADPVKMMQDALPNVVLWVVAIFAFWLLLAAFGMPVPFGKPTQGFQGFITVVSVIVVATIFGHAAGWFPESWGVSEWLNTIDESVLQVILIVAITIGLLVWLLSDPPSGDGDGKKGFFEILGKGLQEIGKSQGNERT